MLRKFITLICLATCLFVLYDSSKAYAATDNQRPTIKLVSPNGPCWVGDKVWFAAEAYDNKGIATMAIYFNDQLVAKNYYQNRIAKQFKLNSSGYLRVQINAMDYSGNISKYNYTLEVYGKA